MLVKIKVNFQMNFKRFIYLKTKKPLTASFLSCQKTKDMAENLTIQRQFF